MALGSREAYRLKLLIDPEFQGVGLLETAKLTIAQHQGSWLPQGRKVM